MANVLRGQIYVTKFDKKIRDEKGKVTSVQNGFRPALIIQNDTGNANSTTTIVAPMTSKLDKPAPVSYTHQCAHQLLYQLESDETKADCRKMYSNKKGYTARELKTKEDWNEWQANALGAAIILPKREVCRVADYMTRGNKIKSTFGQLDFFGNMVVGEISDIFHASASAVKIRLERLGYIEDCTEELVDLRREEALA